jgi:hypothetical protein
MPDLSVKNMLVKSIEHGDILIKWFYQNLRISPSRQQSIISDFNWISFVIK